MPDAAELALVGDLVPSGFPSATGLPITGSSLDNTIRLGELVETEWVLADVHVHAVVNGYGHGIAHLCRGRDVAGHGQPVGVRQTAVGRLTRTLTDSQAQ